MSPKKDPRIDPDEQPPMMLLEVGAWLHSEDVSTMTYEEQGVYMALLCRSWQKVGIPNDPERLARVLGLPKSKFRSIWKNVGRCWEPSGDRLFNPRQELEREKFHANEATKSSRARRAAQKRWDRERSKSGQEAA